MSTFLSNRDGGLTDEEGHYRFQTNVWDGEVIGSGLTVTQNSPLGMSVLVNGGDAKVPYLDYAYTVWIPDGSPEVATITTADPTNPRIDRVVLYVDRAETPQQVNPNNPSIPKIAVVAGTPAASPTRPNDAAVDTAVSNNPWIDIADVLVGAGVTQITNSNITDRRTTVNLPDGSVTDKQLDYPRWWQEIGRATLESTGNTITVSGLPERKYLKLIISTITTGSTGGRILFNNDTGSNYAVRYVSNGSTSTTETSSASGIPFKTTISEDSLAEVLVNNDADREKLAVVISASRGGVGAANAPNMMQASGKWANTSDAITRVDVSGTGFAIGSEVVVLGHD